MSIYELFAQSRTGEEYVQEENVKSLWNIFFILKYVIKSLLQQNHKKKTKNRGLKSLKNELYIIITFDSDYLNMIVELMPNRLEEIK